MKNLEHFKSNTYSQFGEDGIIKELLVRIGRSYSLNNWCIEFGAWDGVKLSNTCRLIREENFSAVLIEGELDRARLIKSNFPQDNVHAICQFVTFEAPNNLDSLLKETPCPRDPDLLSIDIDGCEYYILESLQDYHPKILCIEFNPTIPNEVFYVQPKDLNQKKGSSARAITELCIMKGYTLAAVTYTNLLFVHNSFVGKVLGTQSGKLSEMRDDSEFRTFIFSGMDGTILSNQSKFRLGWHFRELSIPISDFNIVPKYLRKFPSDYNFFQRCFYNIYVLTNLDQKSKMTKILSYLRNRLVP